MFFSFYYLHIFNCTIKHILEKLLRKLLRNYVSNFKLIKCALHLSHTRRHLFQIILRFHLSLRAFRRVACTLTHDILCLCVPCWLYSHPSSTPARAHTQLFLLCTLSKHITRICVKLHIMHVYLVARILLLEKKTTPAMRFILNIWCKANTYNLYVHTAYSTCVRAKGKNR